MDEYQLQKFDPKRVGLEDDKLLLESTIENLKNIRNSFGSNTLKEIERAEAEVNPIRKKLILYKIEQKKYLDRLIQTFELHYYKVIKDDSL